MKIFVGYGYNARDSWIERHVFPILEAMNLEVTHGKDMHGEVLQDGVRDRIGEADALIGFTTLRENQGDADFNSHIWVRDEMQHALTLEKLVVEVREQGVRSPPGLIGDRKATNMKGTSGGRGPYGSRAPTTRWIRSAKSNTRCTQPSLNRCISSRRAAINSSFLRRDGEDLRFTRTSSKKMATCTISSINLASTIPPP
jgi:hypothetical protein